MYDVAIYLCVRIV